MIQICYRFKGSLEFKASNDDIEFEDEWCILGFVDDAGQFKEFIVPTLCENTVPLLSFGEGGNLRWYDAFCFENAVAPPTLLTSGAKWSAFTDG